MSPCYHKSCYHRALLQSKRLCRENGSQAIPLKIHSGHLSGNNLYFTWKRDPDSLPAYYVLKAGSTKPQKISPGERKNLPSFYGTYTRDRSRFVYSKDGDLFLMDNKTGTVKQITLTSGYETNPVFNTKEDKILYSSGNNLFSWDINKGILLQLTDLRSGKEKSGRNAIYR